MKSRFWLLGNRPKGSPTSAVHRYGHLRKHESASQTGQFLSQLSELGIPWHSFLEILSKDSSKPNNHLNDLKVFTIRNLKKNRIVWRFLLLFLGFDSMTSRLSKRASDGFSLKKYMDASWTSPIISEFAYYKPWLLWGRCEISAFAQIHVVFYSTIFKTINSRLVLKGTCRKTCSGFAQKKTNIGVGETPMKSQRYFCHYYYYYYCYFTIIVKYDYYYCYYCELILLLFSMVNVLVPIQLETSYYGSTTIKHE